MSEDTDTPNYAARDPPDPDAPGFDPGGCTYHDRRAYVYHRIREAGGPAFINQAEIARTFDVDPAQISRDVDRLAAAETDRVDTDRYKWTVAGLLRSAAEQAMHDGDVGEKIDAAEALTEWGEKAGLLAAPPERHRVDSRVTVRNGPGLGADGEGFLSEQSRKHFDALEAEARRQCASNTVGRDPDPDDRDHAGDADEQGEDRGRHARRDHADAAAPDPDRGDDPDRDADRADEQADDGPPGYREYLEDNGFD